MTAGLTRSILHTVNYPTWSGIFNKLKFDHLLKKKKKAEESGVPVTECTISDYQHNVTNYLPSKPYTAVFQKIALTSNNIRNYRRITLSLSNFIITGKQIMTSPS